jgi:IS30 family transposase
LARYRATARQWQSDLRARRPKTAKLAANDKLREYVQDRLAGVIAAPNGTSVPGPTARWIGRPHGRRQLAKVQGVGPKQISNRVRVDFPDDESMRVSHEAIYQALFVQGRGALKHELVACLRSGRALRVPKARARQRQNGFGRSDSWLGVVDMTIG